VNYRLSGTDTYPAQVNDVAAAVKWVREHAAVYGGDPTKLVLMGHSAGCHIVSMLALDARPLATVGLKPTDLSGVVAWSGGAYDLEAKVAEARMYAPYIRQNFGESSAGWYDASPIHHVADGAKPPLMFASSELGKVNSRLLSERMAQLVNEAGGNARTLLLEGRTHVMANHMCGAPEDETGPKLLAFVREVTGAKSAMEAAGR
jgi:acetyl esterase/lipase